MSDTPSLTGRWELVFPRYVPAQLFAVVADIEAYPAFVPGCVAIRVVARGEREWRVDNVFGLGPLRRRFTSCAVVDAPHRLDITSTDGPWSDFRLSWRLEPVGEGCRLDCEFSVAFRSAGLASLAAMAMATMERRVVAAFKQRTEQLYG